MFTRYGRTGFVLFAVALYGGPFLAGLAGHGWSVLPVFFALLMLYAAAARKPDLATGAGWAALAMMAATQLALAALAWGAGHAGAVVIGSLMLPQWGPIAITALAAGCGAWAWRDAAEMDVMLDSAIQALERDSRSGDIDRALDWPEPAPEVRAALDETLTMLRGLGHWTPALIEPAVARLEARTGAAAFDAFYDCAGLIGDDNEPVIDFALLRYVARPAVLSALIDRGEGGLAPQLLLDAPDEDVRAEARARVIDLLEAGAAAHQLPDPAHLSGLARVFSDEGYEHLAASCQRV